MNKSGKASSVFLVLVPIIFVLTLIIIDTLFSYLENNRLRKTTETILTEVMKDDEINVEEYSDEIKKRYERSGYSTEMLVVETNSYDVYIENEHSYFGIFSALTSKKNVESEIKLLGLTFKVKKNSVARIKVTASFNYDDELEFEYTK